MRLHLFRWLRLGLFASAWLPMATWGTEAPPKIRLLIIEGVSNHDWQHRLALVKEILARDGSFDISVSTTPAKADAPAWANWRPEFAKYDVVLSGYNNLGGKPRWPAEVERAFEQFVRNGGGFYAYHEANNAFAEWPEYNCMIGLGWRGKDFGRAIVVRPDDTLNHLAQDAAQILQGHRAGAKQPRRVLRQG